MLFPSANRQKSWLFFLLILISVFHIYFNFTFTGTMGERARYLDGAFGRIVWPLQSLVSQARLALGSSSGRIQRWIAAEGENLRLLSENADLSTKLQILEELKIENDRLRSLLEFQKKSTFLSIPAQIIGRDPSPYFRSLLIDKGTEDGVRRLMGVVSKDGIVGQVISVSDRQSHILLINDINSRMDAILQTSRLNVIVGGAPSGGLQLRYLPRRYPLTEGEMVVSSGLNNVFPKGFKVGAVVGIARDPNLVLEEAELEPAIDFFKLEEVFVVGKP